MNGTCSGRRRYCEDIRQCHQSHSAGLPARSTTWTQLPAAKSYASLNYRNAINSSPRDRQTDEETDSVATSAARHWRSTDCNCTALVLGRYRVTGHKEGINVPIFHSENNHFWPERCGNRPTLLSFSEYHLCGRICFVQYIGWGKNCWPLAAVSQNRRHRVLLLVTSPNDNLYYWPA